MRARAARTFRLWLVIAALLCQGSCARNPVTGGRQLALISEGQEIAIGRESHPEIGAEFGIVEDQALQSYVSGIGLEIARVSHRPDLPWTFTVLDSPVVNAFALPGGFIYLTRGILAHMNNEAEMAAVLGHEIGHVTARHSVTQISQQQLLGLGLGLGSIFSPTFRRLSSLAETGLAIMMLKYSRDHERQADQLGIQYMAQAGYDPSQMSRFFQLFVGMNASEGDAIPNWLSSHPAPPARLEATAAAAGKIRRENPGRRYKINADPLMAHIDGMVFGENPREGFVEKNRFLHPDQRFQLDFPRGWAVRNTRSSVTFAAPGEKAVLQLTLVPPNEAQTPEAAGAAVARREGIRLMDGSSLRINGKAAYMGRYRAQTDSGIIEILAAFIAYGKNIYRLAGMAPTAAYSSYAQPFESSMRSFRELSDPRILSVQPDRIRIHRAQKGQTLRSIAQAQSHPGITLDELALLNRLDPDQALSANAPVKLIRPGR